MSRLTKGINIGGLKKGSNKKDYDPVVLLCGFYGNELVLNTAVFAGKPERAPEMIGIAEIQNENDEVKGNKTLTRDGSSNSTLWTSKEQSSQVAVAPEVWKTVCQLGLEDVFHNC